MSDGDSNNNTGTSCSYTSNISDGYYYHHITEDDSEFTITITISSPDLQRANVSKEGETKENGKDKED